MLFLVRNCSAVFLALTVFTSLITLILSSREDLLFLHVFSLPLQESAVVLLITDKRQLKWLPHSFEFKTHFLNHLLLLKNRLHLKFEYSIVILKSPTKDVTTRVHKQQCGRLPRKDEQRHHGPNTQAATWLASENKQKHYCPMSKHPWRTGSHFQRSIISFLL